MFSNKVNYIFKIFLGGTYLMNLNLPQQFDGQTDNCKTAFMQFELKHHI
jgi:hypothetical protein